MSSDIHHDRILILDFGSQYAQLIARRVREAGIYCELHPADMSDDALREFAPRGIILSGAAETATAGDEKPAVVDTVFSLGVPVLGIGYGMLAMAHRLGGGISPAAEADHVRDRVRARGHTRLLDGLEDHRSEEGHGMLDVWISHAEQVTALPPGFVLMASSEQSPLAGMADESRSLYGVQFHPELSHTPRGTAIIERFVHDICGCAALWTPGQIIDDAIGHLRQQVGDDEVLLGLSGGVDSSVVAALLHKAIGRQLTCVFVDTGLLRYREGDQVMATFAEHMGVHVIRVDAEARFLSALAGVTDPEQKRKIIGKMFVDVFEEEAAKLKKAKWLAQGTIYPDVIESAAVKSGKAHLVKSHHNVGGLPEHMKLKLLEPLRELFKDEVRKIGVELGLPHDMVYRHPFPGPGLGVRILGEVKKQYADILRLADHIFIEELRKAGLYDKTSQAFAVFLPVKSVGATAAGRRYEYVISLRAVETVDFMTARCAHLPYEFLETVSRRIILETEGISRVVYDISSKPPATIEWE